MSFLRGIICLLAFLGAPAGGLGVEESATMPAANSVDPAMDGQTAASLAFDEPALPAPETNRTTESATDRNASNAVADTPRRFHYELRLAVRGVYDDNINISNTNRIHDFYFAFEPGISLGLGDTKERVENFIGLDYSPTITRYIDHGEADSEQHFIKILGQFRASRLTLNLSQELQFLNNANIIANSGTDIVNRDIASRTSVNIYTTRLGASYYVSGKTFLSSDLGASISNYDQLISSSVYFADIFVNYDYSPKLTIGLGGGGGYNVVDKPSPNQTFEQIRARLNYHATAKMTFNASAGAEFREFEGNMRGTYVSPVFDIGATYQPFDGTSIDFNASRQTFSSAALGGQDFASTSFTLTARQRLFQRVHVGVAFSYENADYFSTVSNVAGVDSNRTDNYYSVQPSIDVTVTRFWTVGAYFLHRRSDSSFANFSFDDNQVGVQVALKF